MTRFTLVLALAGAALTGPALAATGDGDREHRGRVAFEMFDSDGDGQISREEIEAHGSARFERSDTDKDGFLSAEEITAHMIERAERRTARMIERMDGDGDGKLSADELGDRPGPEKMFDRLDADDSGTISQEEFAAARHGMRKFGRRHGH